jgi:hypothetical protein
MGAYQVCSNESPWFKIGLGPGAYKKVSDFRAIMNLLVKYHRDRDLNLCLNL